MSFLSIKQFVAKRTGLDLVDDLVSLNTLVNEAILDVHKSVDLQGALFEQIFYFDPTRKQIAMPYYVQYLRGIREYVTGFQMQVHDMRPRYASSGWAEQWQEQLLVFRDKQESAVSAYGDSDGPLTFSIPSALTSNITFTVVGGNENSESIRDIVVLAAGSLSATGTKNFSCEKIRTIRKDIVTEYNVTITNIDGLEISSIGNDQFRAAFKLVQIPDYTIRSNDENIYMEALFKYRIQPLVNDEDEFIVPEVFDDAFKWNSIGRYYTGKEGREADVLASLQLRDKSLTDTQVDITAGVKKRMTFMPNKVFNVFNGLRNNSYASRYGSSPR